MGQGKILAGEWLAFTALTPEPAAVARFLEKHGREPARLIRDRGLLLVGPVIEEIPRAGEAEPGQRQLPGLERATRDAR